MKPSSTYRFHGKTPPQAGQRTPVLDSADLVVDGADTAAGVVTMRLYDPIDSWGGDWGVSAKEFAQALDQVPDDTSEIRLHINSPGGEVWEALAILNQLRAHKAKVTAVVDGLAASAASFIAAGADETVMGKNTQLMIHDAWGLAVGNAELLRDTAGRLDQVSNNIASVYAAKTSGTTEDWRAAMVAESWYSAEEAVAAGLADRVEGEADPKAQNRFDLSVFAHAGRDEAPTPPLPSAVAADTKITLKIDAKTIAASLEKAVSIDKQAKAAADGDERKNRFMKRRLGQRKAA